MRMVDLIIKKRDGLELSKEEINYIIEGYCGGDVPDYQVSALLMAIFYKGLTDNETFYLTEAMINSGDIIDLSNIEGIIVDKHSTGGVGDKTSLVVGPLVASLGLKMAKMSGRGLGHTGGTLDKLESIPGFNITIDNDDFIKQVNECGLSIIGQKQNLAYADKLLYALRDVTGTVDSIGLIASSIMSKKIASGANIISLDVKVGSGAFMKNKEDALKLAKLMVKIGKYFNKEVVAILTNMNEPLGKAIGNNLEVIEAINTLKGVGPKDFEDLCIEFASHLASYSMDINEARTILRENLKNGKALEKFKQMVYYQNGDISYIDNIDKFEKSKKVEYYKSKTDGYITKIDAYKIGCESMILHAGRAFKDDIIDYSAGIILHKKVNDYVKEGDILLEVHHNLENLDLTRFDSAFEYGDKPIENELIIDIVR